jgi:transcriptional regulator with GAF, ATPase, and Fis domain
MKLIVVEGGSQSVYRFEMPEVFLGRSIENDLRLDSGLVSRRHCRVALENGEIWIEDLNSANGTVIKGERIVRARIADHDEFMVGGSRIRIELDTEEAKAEPALGALPIEGLQTQDGTGDKGVDRISTFARIATLLAAETELKPLLELIVDSAVALIEAERGFLLLASDSKRANRVAGEPHDLADFEVRLARSFDRSDIPVPQSRLSAGLCRQALSTGRPVLSMDAGRDDRFDAMVSVEDLRLRSVLCLPIHLDDQVAGVLYVDNRMRSGAFSEEDLDVAEHFAALAAVAIRNARQVDALLENNDALRLSGTQIQRLNASLGRKVKDRDAELAVVRRELTRERGRYDYNEIIGTSSAMRKVFQVLDRVVESDLPVRISGDSGTGKELIARAIHNNGKRAKRPFVCENCAAVPDALLESELFGHVKGAFTGADRNRRGLLQQADGGTLFLDEVGDMSDEMQKKLLRVLQEGEVRPVGSTAIEKVDVRVVVASHRDLLSLVESGLFREDLYYRLNVLTVDLPPLRERIEDIPILAEALLVRAAREAGCEPPSVAPEVMAALAGHDWPGNVRELENEMRRSVVLADGIVRLEHLSGPIQNGESRLKSGGSVAPVVTVDGDLRAAVAAFEAGAIRVAIADAESNKSRAAESLGISRFALQRKMEKYEIEVGEKGPTNEGAASDPS